MVDGVGSVSSTGVTNVTNVIKEVEVVSSDDYNGDGSIKAVSTVDIDMLDFVIPTGEIVQNAKYDYAIDMYESADPVAMDAKTKEMIDRLEAEGFAEGVDKVIHKEVRDGKVDFVIEISKSGVASKVGD